MIPSEREHTNQGSERICDVVFVMIFTFVVSGGLLFLVCSVILQHLEHVGLHSGSTLAPMHFGIKLITMLKASET